MSIRTVQDLPVNQCRMFLIVYELPVSQCSMLVTLNEVLRVTSEPV